MIYIVMAVTEHEDRLEVVVYDPPLEVDSDDLKTIATAVEHATRQS